MRNGTLRLLFVIAAAAVAVWLLWTPYRDALDQVSQQLHGDGGRPARAADDVPRRYRRMDCTSGSIWSDKLQCGPWRDDPAPERQRGGGQW